MEHFNFDLDGKLTYPFLPNDINTSWNSAEMKYTEFVTMHRFAV